jgi:hypothetical protein
MEFRRTTQAEDTAAFIQQTASGGHPVAIPGALEVRGRPKAAPAGAGAVATVSGARAPVVFDRARLEREREGGGAPSERAGVRPPTLLSRIADRLRGGIEKRSAPTVPPAA